jgi:hypothetical protein
VASSTSNASVPSNLIFDPSDSGVHSSGIQTRTNRSASNASASHIPTSARHDDIAQHRSELEAAKRENEKLRDRVKELESLLREKRAATSNT